MTASFALGRLCGEPANIWTLICSARSCPSFAGPEIIRLNYSGESIHHPRLLEALQLASKTGAATELVSAFASFPARDIERFVDTGLDRLTISLHTMDPKQFSEIYRFGSLEELKERIEELLTARHRLGSTRPRLDFAFVAMQRNLVQLGPVADYAQSLGIRDVHIHPVIRRHDIPFTFEEELAEGRLRPRFKQTLQQTVDAVRTRHPQLRFNFSTPEVGDDPIIDEHPRHHAGPVREGVRILTCDQNPWETVHILSNGDVVSCEVRDRIVFGNLRQQTLAEVWSSEPYRLFRRRYVKGEDSLCRACSYKVCYKPGPLESVVSAASQRSAQLRRGWHEGDDGNIVWSQRESVAVLGMPAGTRTIGLQGVLPPSPQGERTI